MKSIREFLQDLKNLLPYFLLIVLYFFFVNLEAKKEETEINKIKKSTIFRDNTSKKEVEQLRISIPVIPYKE